MIRENESNADYHADTEYVSHSMMEVYREWVPTYLRRFVEKSEPAPAPTSNMLLGTAFHSALLEPDLFATQYVVSPNYDMRTTAGKAAAKEFALVAAGKTVITAEMSDTIRAMLAAVRRNADADAFLWLPQRRELSIRWQCPFSGVPCRCRPDVLTDSNVIVDVKTSADPTDWVRQAGNFGYHRQAGHYRTGVMLGTDMPRTPSFAHLVVGSKPPHQVIIYRLGEKSLALGEWQNNQDLARIAESMRTGDWSDPREHGVQDVELMPWEFR